MRLKISCLLVAKSSKNSDFWVLGLQGGITHISDMHFQIPLTSAGMWPVLVVFRSATSEGSERK